VVLKRLILVASLAISLIVAFVASSPSVHAARKITATPTPSPAPIAAPTASPEPPQIAIPRLQGKLKANPNDQQAMTELALQYLQIGQPQLVLQLTQRLIQLGNKTAQIYFYDGSAQQSIGNIPAATADFEQASNLDPTNLSVLAQLTDIYVRTSRPNDAERVAKRALTFNKDEPRAYENLGVVYANEGHFDDARTQFEAALKLDPTNSDPIVQIANTYGAQNNIPMALTTIDRALAIDPKNVQTLVYKADLYAKQHDDAHVAQAYDDAVVAATNDAQKVAILTRKAGYYIAEKKNPIAEGILVQTVQQYPKDPLSHVAYGDYLASTRQMPRAQSEWQAALAIDKDNSQALQRMGQAALASGRYSDAVGYLKHYLTLNPTDAQGFALLGQAYSFVHDYTRSRDACGRSFQIQRTPETLGCVGGADFELKNYKEGAGIFDVLANNAKGFLDQNPQMLFVAAKCWEHTNQKQKALSAYKALLPLMKKGTKEYKSIQQSIADLSKTKRG
jgi:tetratricopeptide (TPR) repeat protein